MLSQNQNNIEIIHVKDKFEGSLKALEILCDSVNSNTALFLSGGTSPDTLYSLIAKNKGVRPGVVGLVDERFGKIMHKNSNESMISQTGLFRYLEELDVPVYKILTDTDPITCVKSYEGVLETVFSKFSKCVGVMGIGADGHTAGIKPDLGYKGNNLVTYYNDSKGNFGERITTTFNALSKFNLFVILAFGSNKANAINSMFTEKDRNKIPASFYCWIETPVYLITDSDISKLVRNQPEPVYV